MNFRWCHNREYLTSVLGIETMDGFVIASGPCATDAETQIDYGQNFRNVVRGEVTGLTRISKVRGGRCRVTHTMHWSGEGNLPAWAMPRDIKDSLGIVDSLRTTFQRDDEVDADEIGGIVKSMTKQRETGNRYGASEKASISMALERLSHINDVELVEFESQDSFVRIGMAKKAPAGLVIVRATTVVDATPEQCAAFGECASERSERSRACERAHVRASSRASERAHVRPRRPGGGFEGSPRDSPRFCPSGCLLPFCFLLASLALAHERRVRAAPSSSCSLRSRPSILPALATKEQLQRVALASLARGGQPLPPALTCARFARALTPPHGSFRQDEQGGHEAAPGQRRPGP
jgi:hypothetical protein